MNKNEDELFENRTIQKYLVVEEKGKQNLWNMRQFYLEYKENLKLQSQVREISWTKNIFSRSHALRGNERK